ncbi:MAG TPA: hypothetical protein VGF23_15035 [Gaiellaceae bacterium]|jgi:hypothetical protein
MAEDRVRIEIGFDGGQIMSVSATTASADALGKALEGGGNGVVVIEAEDGHYAVTLAHVAYVKRFSRESRVGFGA